VSSFRTTFAYTNITHLVAGRVVAGAEGAKRWSDVLRKEIFDPLGMGFTYLTPLADHATFFP
jgi:CubicO group peptidase (beta-lactamase class C family)